MSTPLLSINTRVPEEMKESMVAEALAGAQHHRQLPPRRLEVGGVGQAPQAQILEVLAGESRDQPLGGTAKFHQMLEVGRGAGMTDPAIRVVTTTATPGATTLTKMTGPALGPMHPNHRRAGVPTVEMEVKPGVAVAMVPEGDPATTGGSPKKVQAQWAGTATATGLALDVGASPAGQTPAAVTPGLGVEDQILQTRALQTQAPTGETQSTNLILRVTVRAGVSQLRTTTEPRTGESQILSPLTSGEKVLNPICPEAIKVLTSPQAGLVAPYPQ